MQQGERIMGLWDNNGLSCLLSIYAMSMFRMSKQDQAMVP